MGFGLSEAIAVIFMSSPRYSDRWPHAELRIYASRDISSALRPASQSASPLGKLSGKIHAFSVILCTSLRQPLTRDGATLRYLSWLLGPVDLAFAVMVLPPIFSFRLTPSRSLL